MFQRGFRQFSKALEIKNHQTIDSERDGAVAAPAQCLSLIRVWTAYGSLLILCARLWRRLELGRVPANGGRVANQCP